MTKRLILKKDLDNALTEGLVAFVFDHEGEKAHAFFTRNHEIASYVAPQVDTSQLSNINRIIAFNVLTKEVTEIHPAFFSGQVYQITSLGEPSENSINYESKLYLGNRTGAKSISKRIYEASKSATLDELGILDDEQFYVFDTVVELESDTEDDSSVVQKLSAIYLYKEGN